MTALFFFLDPDTRMVADILFHWVLKGLILSFLLKPMLSLNPDDPNVCSHWER